MTTVVLSLSEHGFTAMNVQILTFVLDVGKQKNIPQCTYNCYVSCIVPGVPKTPNV